MKKIIGIDFDGTCVVDSFPYVGDNIGAAKVLRELADKNLLILYTVRDGKVYHPRIWFPIDVIFIIVVAIKVVYGYIGIILQCA